MKNCSKIIYLKFNDYIILHSSRIFVLLYYLSTKETGRQVEFSLETTLHYKVHLCGNVVRVFKKMYIKIQKEEFKLFI